MTDHGAAPLENQRMEKFAVALSKGRSQGQAYQDAIPPGQAHSLDPRTLRVSGKGVTHTEFDPCNTVAAGRAIPAARCACSSPALTSSITGTRGRSSSLLTLLKISC